MVSPAPGLSIFADAGAAHLNHHNNRFEDGYDAVLPTVTVGADYWFTPTLLAGVAFNYTNFDGSYDDGGSFDKNIFRPLLYATFMPFHHAFINAVMSYSRNETNNERKVIVPQGTDNPPVVGHTTADYPENLYSAGLQTGYNQPIGDFTVSVRRLARQEWV